MTDTTQQVVNQQNAKAGLGKFGASIVSAIVARHATSYLESHYGMDFKFLGVDPELVKDMIVGSGVGFFTLLTPNNFVQWVVDCIIFARITWAKWNAALTKPITDGEQK